MGVKLRSTVNPLEASVKNSILSIYYFDRVIKEVEIPIPKGIEIERQCNFYKTILDNVVVYLRNDKYTLLIRSCGHIDVMTNTFILLFRSKMDVNKILDESLKVTFCGSLSIMGNVAPAYLAIPSMKESIFIYTDKSAVTVLLDIKDEINRSIYDWALSHNDVGTMHIMDNSTNGTALWVNFGTNDYIQMSNYKILSSKGIIGGIVI